MIKAVWLVKRKPELSHEEFVRYYEEVHVPLAERNLRRIPSVRRYARNYAFASSGGDEPDYDCMTEIWFEGMETCEKTLQAYVSEDNRHIHEDEDAFTDRAKLVHFVAEEHVSEMDSCPPG